MEDDPPRPPPVLDSDDLILCVYPANDIAKLIYHLEVSKIDPNQATTSGHRVLNTAVQYRRTDMIKILLAHGADPKLVDKVDDTTPLDWLDVKDPSCVEIATILLQNGHPSPSPANVWKSIKSDVADPAELLRAYIRYSDIDLLPLRDPRGLTILHHAAEMNIEAKSIPLMEVMVNNFPELLDVCHEWNKTPLVYALDCHHESLEANVVWLIRRGSEVDTLNVLGYTPFQLAVRRGFLRAALEMYTRRRDEVNHSQSEILLMLHNLALHLGIIAGSLDDM